MAEALQTSEEADLSFREETAEVDSALLELEQALHRREALIVVTGQRGRQHSSLVRTALARFDEAYVVVLISPANAEPILALDRLLETAGHEIGNATGEEKQAALGGLIDRAGELGRPVIVVVDDAHLATVAQLERLRTALNIDPGARRPVQLVLAGTQKLVRNLKSREARGLWTRVTAHIDIPEEETLVEEKKMRTPSDEAASRRWPLVTLVSAGALVVALLVVASLARNYATGPETSSAPVTAIEPARPAQTSAPTNPIGASSAPRPSPPPAMPAAPDAAATPALANAQPPAPAQAPATPQLSDPGQAPAAAAAQPLSAVGTLPPAAGAQLSSAAQPTEPTSAAGGDAAAATVSNEQATAAGPPTTQTGPRVTQWMGVETVHGSARLHVPPAAPGAAPAAAQPAATQPSAAAAASAQANHDAPAAGEHPSNTPVAQARRGAQVVEIEDGQEAAPSSPAAMARAAVAADMAKATQAEDSERPGEEGAKSPASEHAATPAAAAQPKGQAPAAPHSAATHAPSGFEIQLGAFRTMANAAKVRDAVVAEFPSARIDEITVAGTTLYRVRVGPLRAEETSRAEKRLRSLGFTPVRFNSSIKTG